MDINPKGDDLHPFVKQLIELTGTKPEDVLSLAVAIDTALDKAEGYGTSVCNSSLTAPAVYGEIANLSSAAFALAAIAHSEKDDEDFIVSLNEAIHSGWSYSVIHCGNFHSSGKREAKLLLVAKPFWLLPRSEQVKDQVAVEAVHEWLRRI
tara:strand:- start:129 stop:581 length:453 start_codon:yes stop_codon:yes gene_type:complete